MKIQINAIFFLSLALLPFGLFANPGAVTTNDVSNALAELPEDTKIQIRAVETVLATCQQSHSSDFKAFRECSLSEVGKLAVIGNFAAAYKLGLFAQEEGNKEEALKWFKKVDETPNLPKIFKDTVQERLQKLEMPN